MNNTEEAVEAKPIPDDSHHHKKTTTTFRCRAAHAMFSCRFFCTRITDDDVIEPGEVEDKSARSDSGGCSKPEAR